METNATPITPVSVGIRYGLLLAVSGILVDFGVRVAGLSFLSFAIVGTTLALIVGIVWLVVAHRNFKQSNGGLMSFSQGLIIALIMLLIAGIASSLFNYLYVHTIDPEFVNNLKLQMREFMERNNVPDDQIEQSTARFDEMKTSLGKALIDGITRGIGSGLLLGAIITAFTKRSAPEFE